MLEKILMILNLIVALGSMGVVYYAHNVIKPPPTDLKAEVDSLKTNVATMSQIQPVLIKKFAVNLHAKSSRLKYLDVEMNVLTFEESQKEIIKANEHLFKDVTIEIASHLGPEDLDTVTGKLLFENKIKAEINSKLGESPIIKKIFFSVFVIQ